MSASIRNDEFAPVGDFLKISFQRDLAVISARYPKLNQAFLDAFSNRLERVKVLESGLMATNEQKAATKSLGDEARALNKELNFLSDYFTDAGLDARPVSQLKDDLTRGDIEGAILKIEGVKQLVIANKAALVEEGMHAGFDITLGDHKASLAAKNASQNKHLNDRKAITKENKEKYDELEADIVKITTAGKRVFDDTVTQDEYILSKILKRMRAANRNEQENQQEP